MVPNFSTNSIDKFYWIDGISVASVNTVLRRFAMFKIPLPLSVPRDLEFVPYIWSWIKYIQKTSMILLLWAISSWELQRLPLLIVNTFNRNEAIMITKNWRLVLRLPLLIEMLYVRWQAVHRKDSNGFKYNFDSIIDQLTQSIFNGDKSWFVGTMRLSGVKALAGYLMKLREGSVLSNIAAFLRLGPYTRRVEAAQLWLPRLSQLATAKGNGSPSRCQSSGRTLWIHF
jgi:hypothetical protein